MFVSSDRGLAKTGISMRIILGGEELRKGYDHTYYDHTYVLGFTLLGICFLSLRVDYLTSVLWWESLHSFLPFVLLFILLFWLLLLCFYYSTYLGFHSL